MLVQVVRWSARTVGAGDDLRFLGKQPASEVSRGVATAASSTLLLARGYLPNCRASPPFARYQFILLGEQRHTCVNNLPKVVS